MESTKFLPRLLITGFLAFGSAAAIGADRDLDLEPCVNGDVSATGLYQTQAQEDAASRENQKPSVTVKKQGLGSGDEDVISAFGGQRDDFSR